MDKEKEYKIFSIITTLTTVFKYDNDKAQKIEKLLNNFDFETIKFMKKTFDMVDLRYDEISPNYDIEKVLNVILFINKLFPNEHYSHLYVVDKVMEYNRYNHTSIINGLYEKYLSNRNIEINENNIPEELYIFYKYLYEFEYINEIDNYDDMVKKYKRHETEAKNILNLSLEKEVDINKYKNALLYLNYGITLSQANYLNQYLGQYLDDLEKTIIDEDKEVFETLKAICSIVKVKDLTKKEINTMSIMTLEYSANKNQKYIPFDHFIMYFKEMYKNAYNNKFFNIEKINNKTTKGNYPRIIKELDGVNIIDPGTEFLMLLHSVNRNDIHFERGTIDELDGLQIDKYFKEKWENKLSQRVKGFSQSIIGPDNNGLIIDCLYYLGYNGLYDQDLVTMSLGDAYTGDSYWDSKQKSINNYFIPPNKICDESRYGYTEFYASEARMPDYILAVSSVDEIKEDNNAYLCAKKLGCPLVCLDKEKVKNKLVENILKLEDKLFYGDDVKPYLINEIICKYMNIYTGSIVSSRREDKLDPEYSMVDEMNLFLEKVNNKIDSIEDISLKKAWLNELIYAYNNELRKYLEAKNITRYMYTVEEFILYDERYVNMNSLIVQKFNEINSNIKNK